MSSFILVFKYTDINKVEKQPWIKELKMIFKAGIPRGLQIGLNALQSWVISCVVLYALDMNGLAAKAACSSCFSVVSILFRSVSEVMQPLAGVLHGAEDKEGSKKLINISLILAVSLTLICQTLIELFPGAVLFAYGIKSPDANQIAVLRIFCSFFFLNAGINLITDYFSSVLESGVASLLTSPNGSPVFIPILLALNFTLGGVYVWYAYLFTAIIAGTAAIILLRKHIRTKLIVEKTQTKEWYLSIFPEDGITISDLVVQNFGENDNNKKIAFHMGVFLEELTMYIRENNPVAEIDISIKEKENEFVILLFYNGVHRDYAFELENVELFDRLRVARLMSSEVLYRNVLGLNYVSASFAK